MPIRPNVLDPDLLEAFVAVVDCHSMSRAAERLNRSQPTISLQIRRLEERLGVTLLSRSHRRVLPTLDGERILETARRFLALHDELAGMVGGAGMTGTVRLGAPEDFASFHLPNTLARFLHHHPEVSLEVVCDLTLNLLDQFTAGGIDLAFIKREPSSDVAGARLVWRERLVWITADADLVRRAGPIPLVASPHPCVYRKRATAALDSVGRAWRVAYTCGSLAGAHAAVRAGLGVMVCPKAMAPADLIRLEGPDAPLPQLDDTEVALLAARPLSPAAGALMNLLLSDLERR